MTDFSSAIPTVQSSSSTLKLHELKALLQQHPDKLLRFVLPDGDVIPAHFHVTEVGYVAKKFVDCGGTFRDVESCVLQIWVAEDQEHRLHAGKLGMVLNLAGPILPHEELNVEVEYEDCVISQYPLGQAQVEGQHLIFALTNKHTDCLAKQLCGLDAGVCGGNDGGCC